MTSSTTSSTKKTRIIKKLLQRTYFEGNEYLEIGIDEAGRGEQR